MEEIHRKKYITGRKYQLKYAFVVVCAVLVAAAAIMGAVYRDLMTAYPEVAADIFQWEKYFTRLGVIVVVVLLIGLFLSHKIIGPVLRLSSTLNRINKGDFKARIKLRSGDEFLRLGDEINVLANRLESLSKEIPEIKDKFKEY